MKLFFRVKIFSSFFTKLESMQKLKCDIEGSKTVLREINSINKQMFYNFKLFSTILKAFLNKKDVNKIILEAK